jgi:hypothetical protein
MQDESDQLPHVRPAPTADDKKYERQRDQLLDKAGRQLAERDAAARRAAEFLKRQRGQ